MLPPRGGRTNQATLPPSPGPHDSALELGGGGELGWLRPYRPSLPPPAPQSFKLLPCYPHLPFLCHPPLHNLLPEKGNRNQEGGVSEGRGSPPPHTQPKPRGHGSATGFGPKPQTPRNPHSRSGTPQIKDRLLLQFPSSSWGQGPYLYCVCSACDIQIHTHRYFMYNALGDHPNLESLCPKTSAWNWNEGSWGKGG